MFHALLFGIQCISVFLWIIFCSFIGFFQLPFRWGDLNLNHDIARWISLGGRWITGVKLNLENLNQLEAHQPCVYVGNHQSAFDLVIFGSLYPHRTIVVGKKELIWIPLFGLFFMAAGNILINRRHRKKAIAGLDQAITTMSQKTASLWLFPEGTRNRTDQELLPFKKGAFYAAIKLGMPIVPVIVAPYRQFHWWKNHQIWGRHLYVRVLPPILTREMTLDQVDELSQQVREQMLQGVREYSLQYREASKRD